MASRVETAVTMRSVTNSMGSVVKGMDKAMESMNLERVSCSLILAFGTEWMVLSSLRSGPSGWWNRYSDCLLDEIGVWDG